MKKALALSAALAGMWVWRGRGRNTGPSARPPGSGKQMDTWMLEAGAALLQNKSPIRAMNLYLNGFHFYADDMGHQMEAHHFCSRVNEDFIQCVIFDGNTREARLIGVEYIVSERLFRTLPEAERRLWHSHHYEVKSGTLTAPGIPRRVEHELMKKVIGTYGKVWHTWDTTRHDLPLGIPALMMGFTADGQAHPGLVEDRDRRFGVSTSRIKAERQDIPVPQLVPGANAWEGGETRQLELKELPMLAARGQREALAH